MQRPPWLDEQPEIRALLARFLDKLDARPADTWKQLPAITVGSRTLPGLFRHDEAADRQWALLQSLAGHILDIAPAAKRGPFDPEYVGARLRLRLDAEDVLRAWLDRPRAVPYPTQWREAVASLKPGPGPDLAPARTLALRPAKLPGKSALEVARAFMGLAEHAHDAPSLRQLSARAFWGHSKFLDGREDLVQALFPGMRLRPRPVLVHVRPVTPGSGVLFIENQDTYVRALGDGTLEGRAGSGHAAATHSLTLVYVAGYRGSAERIRERDGASLHYAAGTGDTAAFESWWFKESAAHPPLWFWGDLDFAGMDILKTLRARFGDVAAWQPGYQAMLRHLEAGHGHAPEVAVKGEQTDPGSTGCPYADQVLLPAIRAHGAFVDQEIV